MPNYFTRASYYDETVGMVYQPEPAVVVSDDAVDTGLLDSVGNPIFRTERIALGFDISPRPRVRVKAGSRMA